MEEGYVRVRCLKTWRDQTQGLAYAQGQEFKATEGHANALLRAAPASFRIVEEAAKGKALDAPPKDKRIRRPRVKK